MFTPGNVIYAFFNSTHPPKPKYLISLYKSDELCVIACFTTSLPRAGVPLENIKHGKNVNSEGEVVSYVFLKDKVIGVKPDGTPFSFPEQTTVRFDYTLQTNTQDAFLKLMSNPIVVGKLSEKEYLDLIYSMYQSNDINEESIKCFESILTEKLGNS